MAAMFVPDRPESACAQQGLPMFTDKVSNTYINSTLGVIVLVCCHFGTGS
jgi:hypothetical protein